MKGVKSVELMKKYLTLDGLNFYLSDKLSQDPFGKHFGIKGACRSASDNLMLEQYAKNENNILAAKSTSIYVM